MRGLVILLLAASSLVTYAVRQEVFDTLQPIVKISPARDSQATLDRFGFAVAVIRQEDVSVDDSLEEALEKTTYV